MDSPAIGTDGDGPPLAFGVIVLTLLVGVLLAGARRAQRRSNPTLATGLLVALAATGLTIFSVAHAPAAHFALKAATSTKFRLGHRGLRHDPARPGWDRGAPPPGRTGRRTGGGGLRRSGGRRGSPRTELDALGDSTVSAAQGGEVVDYGQLWSQVEAIGSDPDAVLEPGAPDRLFTFLDLPGLVDDVLADDFPADDLTRYYELQSIPESGEVSAWLEDLD